MKILHKLVTTALLVALLCVVGNPMTADASNVRYNMAANSAKGEGQANAPDGYVAGSKPSYRIGLAHLRTDGGVFDSSINASSTQAQKAAAIQKYASTHYVGCDGTAYMLMGESGTGNNTYRYSQGDVVNKMYSVTASNPIGAVLKELEEHTVGNYLIEGSDGSLSINPAKVNAIMNAFYETGNSYNQQMYNSWLKENMVNDAAQNPVVIVIEVQGFVVAKNNHYLVSAGDMAVWNGGDYNTLRNTALTDLDTIGGNTSSLTDRAIASMVGYGGGEVRDTWPQRWTKHMFCTWWDASSPTCAISQSKNPKVWTNWANEAYMSGSRGNTTLHGLLTGTNTTSTSDLDIDASTTGGYINGCSILVIGEPTPEVLKFTWELDCNDAVNRWSANTDGQDRSNETIQCPEGYTNPKVTNLSDITFEQENSEVWRNYFVSKGMNTFTINLTPKYSPDTQDYASLNKSLLTPELRVNGVPQAGMSYTTDLDGMMSVIKGDTTFKIYSRIQTTKSSNFGAFKIQASINTNVGSVKVDDGKYVNWICYTDSTANVITYDQKVKIPTAQVQANKVLGEKYNVGAGVPTTENLYVEMGGEQYVVKLQMILADASYKRKYTFNRTAAPNAIYYSVGTGTASQTGTTHNETVTKDWTETAAPWADGLDHDAQEQSVMNNAWSKTSSSAITESIITSVTRCDAYGHLTSTTYTVNQGPGVSMDLNSLRSAVNSFVSGCENGMNDDSIDIIAMHVADPDCSGKTYSTTIHVEYHANHQTNYNTDVSSRVIDTGACNNPAHYDIDHDHFAGPGPCTYNHITQYKGSTTWKYDAGFNFQVTVNNSDANILAPTVPAQTDVFYQTFNNVKYLDVTNASVWLLDNGMVANNVPYYDSDSEQYAWYKDDDVASTDKATLGTLITNDNLAQNVMLAAVNQLGYYSYDARTEVTSFKYDKGTGTYTGTFMDGESYGRLSNSYKQLASSANLTLDVGNYGDSITWTYNPQTYGGRTHYSASTWAYSNLAYEMKRAYNDVVVTSDVLMLESGVTKVNEDNLSTSKGWQDWVSGWYTSNANGTSTQIMKPTYYNMYYKDTPLIADVSNVGRIASTLDTKNCGVTRSLNYVTEPMTAMNPAGVGGAYLNNNQCFTGTIAEKNGANTIGFLGMSEANQRAWAETAKTNCSFTAADLASEKTVTVNGKACVLRKDLPTASAKTQQGSGSISSTANATEDNAYKSNVHTSTTLQPYMTELNLKRTLSNSIYRSGFATLNYGQVVSVVAQSGGTSSDIGWIIPSDTSDISKASPRLDSMNYVDVDGTTLDTSMDSQYVTSKGLSLNCWYDNGSGSHLTINNIVVFNPIGMTVKFNDLSKYLPDGTNDESTVNNANPLRDQRVAGYSVLRGTGENDVVLTEDKSATATISSNVTMEEQYTLRDSSLEGTSYYVETDYDVSKENTVLNEQTYNAASGSVSYYSNTSTYTKDVQIRGNSVSDIYGTVSLQSMRSVVMDGSALYIKGRSTTVPFTEITTALALDAGEDYTINAGAVTGSSNFVMTMYLDGLGKLQKGEVFTVSLLTDSLTDRPTSAVIKDDTGNVTTDLYNAVVTTVASGTDYLTTYTMEVKNDVQLDSLTYEFGNGTTLNDVNLKFDDIFLCDIGAVANASGELVDIITTSTANGPTQQYLYTGDNSVLRSSATHKMSYNSLFFKKTTGPVVVTSTQSTIAERYFYMAEFVVNYSRTLKQSSELNPHKVENANWKMHVLGWTTDAGEVINNVMESSLNDDTVKLKWPNSNEYVTVGQLRTDGVLVRYCGTVYLTTQEAYANKRIMEAGITVSSFDTFTFSNEINMEDDTATINTNVNNAGRSTYDDTIYTWAFKVTNSNQFVYDVRTSKSAEHRYAYDAITKVSVGNLMNPAYTEDWMVDWTSQMVAVDPEDNTTKVDEVARNNNSVFINLDDEFSVYYDNYNTMGPVNEWSNYPATISTKDKAGFGYTNINTATNLNQTGDVSYTPKNVDGNVQIDTSKWIYRKTATFAYDVFYFGNPNRPYSVALKMAQDASASSGGSITVEEAMKSMAVFVPAGTPVDLGTYTNYSDMSDASTLTKAPGTYNKVLDPGYLSYSNADIRASNGGVTHTGFANLETDNTAHFFDYGKSLAGNGKGTGGGAEYTYYFWCALSAGESASSSMTLRTYGINDLNDEPASDIVCNRDGNGDKLRYTSLLKTLQCDVVGRVGALTMLDTGDYRFSNSFKTTDPDSQWLVYGLINKIFTYSNQQGIPSTQSKYLSDMFDVRGRDAHTYNTSSELGDLYNTYSTQWFKNATTSSKTHGAQQVGLPLTGKFNDITSLQMTEQKLGYLNYMSLETIGNYFGQSTDNGDSSGDNASALTKEDVPAVNVNEDYGQYKLQIRPVYLGVDESGNWFPVDVYAKNSAGQYTMINVAPRVEATDVSVSDYNALLNSTYRKNTYNYYLERNTNKYKLSLSNATEDSVEINKTIDSILSQSLMRRMITEEEALNTEYVVEQYNKMAKANYDDISVSGYKNLFDDWNSYIDENEESPMYYLGNAQYLNLRSACRTFVGGQSVALAGADSDYHATLNAKLNAEADAYVPCDTLGYIYNAQKWQFNLGLPTSAVFVRHGEKVTKSSILNGKNIRILSTVQVYANGSVWMLGYKNAPTQVSLHGTTYDYSTWNVYEDANDFNLIPVTFYDLSKESAVVDLSDGGTH